MAGQFKFYNGALPTTAALVHVTTGTAIKTLLQVATPSTTKIQVVSWGISFDGASFGTKVACELIDTDVAATVTTGSGHILKMQNTADASLMTVGTSATGYTASVEGSITATRPLDVQKVDGSGAYSYEWSLGNYPEVAASRFLRIRVTTGTAVNAHCWVVWNE